MNDETKAGVSRRGLLAGAGTVAVLGAMGVGSSAAGASTPHPDSASVPDTSPVSSTIASAPIYGVSYRHVAMWDFTAEDPTGKRTFGGEGIYVAGATSTANLWASVDIPAGAQVHDVEWYVYNATGSSVAADCRLFTAGNGFLGTTVVDGTIAPNGGHITATRLVAPTTSNGPFPLGTKLFLLFPNSTNNVQVSGARVGFAQGGAELGFLPNPVRVYDSRHTGGRFAAGETRIINIPAAYSPTGTFAITANLSAVQTSGPGYLTAYAANANRPGTASLVYGKGADVSNAVTVGVSPSRQIKVYTPTATDVTLDITGFVG